MAIPPRPAMVGADPCWACAQQWVSLAIIDPARPKLPDSSLTMPDIAIDQILGAFFVAVNSFSRVHFRPY